MSTSLQEYKLKCNSVIDSTQMCFQIFFFVIVYIEMQMRRVLLQVN